METATSYRLKVRIGNAEFEAEGPEAQVQEQFDRFLKIVEGSGQTAMTGKAAANGADKTGTDKVFQDELLEQAFASDGDLVSLHALPTTDDPRGDALIMLLYGFRRLKQQNHVTALDLVKAARQSGLALDRVDRVMPVGLHHKGGLKRATKYSLNNPGIAKAEGLIEEMFG